MGVVCLLLLTVPAGRGEVAGDNTNNVLPGGAAKAHADRKKPQTAARDLLLLPAGQPPLLQAPPLLPTNQLLVAQLTVSSLL